MKRKRLVLLNTVFSTFAGRVFRTICQQQPIEFKIITVKLPLSLQWQAVLHRQLQFWLDDQDIQKKSRDNVIFKTVSKLRIVLCVLRWLPYKQTQKGKFLTSVLTVMLH